MTGTLLALCLAAGAQAPAAELFKAPVFDPAPARTWQTAFTQFSRWVIQVEEPERVKTVLAGDESWRRLYFTDFKDPAGLSMISPIVQQLAGRPELRARMENIRGLKAADQAALVRDLSEARRAAKPAVEEAAAAALKALATREVGPQDPDSLKAGMLEAAEAERRLDGLTFYGGKALQGHHNAAKEVLAKLKALFVSALIADGARRLGGTGLDGADAGGVQAGGEPQAPQSRFLRDLEARVANYRRFLDLHRQELLKVEGIRDAHVNLNFDANPASPSLQITLHVDPASETERGITKIIQGLEDTVPGIEDYDYNFWTHDPHAGAPAKVPELELSVEPTWVPTLEFADSVHQTERDLLKLALTAKRAAFEKFLTDSKLPADKVHDLRFAVSQVKYDHRPQKTGGARLVYVVDVTGAGSAVHHFSLDLDTRTLGLQVHMTRPSTILN